MFATSAVRPEWRRAVHTHSLRPWQHDHAFGQGVRRAGERRTLFVALLTASMMVIEIAAGIVFGSMALLADGLHMASHAAALALAVAAYVYARRHAHDRRFTFGTGKVNALAGYSGAVVLAMFALLMVWESGNRLLLPRPIDFDQAILVACLGLAVNLGSMLLLRGEHHHHAAADEDRHHDDTYDHDHHATDHNIRGAYLHVLADALTSVLAIAALGAGKMLGWRASSTPRSRCIAAGTESDGAIQHEPSLSRCETAPRRQVR
jgi:cation diffusion facilitator family transporter